MRCRSTTSSARTNRVRRCLWRRRWPTRPTGAPTPAANSSMAFLPSWNDLPSEFVMIERSATDLLALLSRGEATSEALTGAFLQSIRTRDPQVRAFLHVDAASALAQARAVDARRRN